MTNARTISPRKTLTLVKGKRRQKTFADTTPVANSAAHDAVVTKNSAVLPDGAHTVDSDAARHASFVGISPGNGPDSKSSIDYYADQIDQNWQRGVNAFMTIARLCADASAELSVKGRRELLKQLPFGASAFSKFSQIGNDHRLNTPELRRLLPPHYTIAYAIATLTDQELQEAIAAKVIRPDMSRVGLEKWRNAYHELLPGDGSDSSPEETPGDSEVAKRHTVKDAPNWKESTRNTNIQTGSEVSSPKVPRNAATEEAACPSVAPTSDEEIPACLDRRPLSPEDQRAFVAIKAAWESHVRKLWSSSSEIVRERIFAVLRADPLVRQVK